MRQIDADTMLARLEKWNTSDSMDKALYNFALDRILEQPTIKPEPQWIPVSERLPEVGSKVLTCFDFKGKRSVCISEFYSDGKFHGLDDEYLTKEGRKYRKAVAWMPMPEPYEEEKKK